MGIISAGCDWLSVTQFRNTPQAAKLRRLAQRLYDVQRSRGYDDAPRFLGHGYKTFGSEGLTFGERPDDVLFELRGELALRFARFALPYARNCTRCDVQVTYDLGTSNYRHAIGGGPWPDYAKHCAEELERNGRSGRGRRWPLKERGKLILGIPFGDTLNVGSKKSERQLCIYDKGVESLRVERGECEVGQIWRAEVRHRKRYAMSAAQTVLREYRHTREKAIDLVATQMETEGITPLFERKGKVRAKADEKPTDDFRRLLWLTGEGVAPCSAALEGKGFRSLLLQSLLPELHAELKKRAPDLLDQGAPQLRAVK